MSAVAAPTIYETVSALDRHFGGAFVCAPTRWGTADGTISYRALYPAAEMMRRQQAAERLHLARAQWMSTGSPDAVNAGKTDEKVAHGLA